MCSHCDDEVESLTKVVEAIIGGECQQRKLFPRHTQGQHSVRLANIIGDVYTDDNDAMTPEGLRSVILSFAITVQKLIALQEISGLS